MLVVVQWPYYLDVPLFSTSCSLCVWKIPVEEDYQTVFSLDLNQELHIRDSEPNVFLFFEAPSPLNFWDTQHCPFLIFSCIPWMHFLSSCNVFHYNYLLVSLKMRFVFVLCLLYCWGMILESRNGGGNDFILSGINAIENNIRDLI